MKHLKRVTVARADTAPPAVITNFLNWLHRVIDPDGGKMT